MFHWNLNPSATGNAPRAFSPKDISGLVLWSESFDPSTITLDFSGGAIAGATASGFAGGNVVALNQATGAIKAGQALRFGSTAGSAAQADDANTYPVAKVVNKTLILAKNLASDLSSAAVYSGVVAKWADKSGKDNHYAQSVPSKRPTYDFAAKQIVFTAAQSLVGGPANKVGQGWSVFAVSGHNGPVRHRFLAGTGDSLIGFWSSKQGILYLDNKPRLLTGPAADLNLHLYACVKKSDATGFLDFDDRSRRNFSNMNSKSYAWSLNDGTQPWLQPSDHRAKELIFFHDDMADADVLKIQGYLAHKHKITDRLPAGHTYKNTAPASGGKDMRTRTVALKAHVWKSLGKLNQLIISTPRNQLVQIGFSDNEPVDNYHVIQPHLVDNLASFSGFNSNVWLRVERDADLRVTL